MNAPKPSNTLLPVLLALIPTVTSCGQNPAFSNVSSGLGINQANTLSAPTPNQGSQSDATAKRPEDHSNATNPPTDKPGDNSNLADSKSENSDAAKLLAGCAAEASLVSANKTVLISWAPVQLPDGSKVIVTGPGSATIQDHASVLYAAPASVAEQASADLEVIAAGGQSLGHCSVRIAPDASLGVKDDGSTRGLVGSVFELPAGTGSLPDFSALTAVGNIVTPNLNVPNHPFTDGFPGVAPSLIEWFGIRFDGQIAIPKDGTYDFKIASDDGAILYIDGKPIINNDGVHSVTEKEGSVTLSAGAHAIRVDYFQGPRFFIALQVFWRVDGSGQDYALIPPESLSRPKP